MLLFRGVKVIIVNWRLTLVELVPAVLIGLTWWDLRVHLFGVRDLAVVHDIGLVVVAVGVVVITVVFYWCNAVFAFAVENPDGPGCGPPSARPEPTTASSMRGASVWASPMRSCRPW